MTTLLYQVARDRLQSQTRFQGSMNALRKQLSRLVELQLAKNFHAGSRKQNILASLE
jgi:hypothetical protein